MKKQKPFVIANWKMHPLDFAAAKALFDGVARKVRTIKKTQIVVCPPALFLDSLAWHYTGKHIQFGAQDSSPASKAEGSYTGELSPEMLKVAGATYAIVGHSERRAGGETDAVVAQKIKRAVAAGLDVVLCVGEAERDTHGAYLQYIATQLREALGALPKDKVRQHVLVAYEPIWAIGKSAKDALHADGVAQMMLFIKKTLTDMFGRTIGMHLPLLYGGSAEPDNVAELFTEGGVNGFLVGHASLVPDDFVAIITTVEATH